MVAVKHLKVLQLRPKVDSFIGPYCSAEKTLPVVTEIDAVARLATFWNNTVISYMTASNTLSDKNTYKTPVRISMSSTSSFVAATYALLRLYCWNKVAIVTNISTLACGTATAFEEVFTLKEVSVVKKIMFEENAEAGLFRNYATRLEKGQEGGLSLVGVHATQLPLKNRVSCSFGGGLFILVNTTTVS
ncbi:hypothetical protein Tcan_07028 [Toxocara canis]|uniref:Receptor ligand binding region domain-containing protein n=1 Tax=Toxocara canis TaxID=6265 RepID=A0A0B2VZL8_TOXCA|nr:hypothetical protein Tcan_07028 [Toxocara canis]